jgi:general secretion pathway protein E
VDLGVEPYLISSSVNAIIAQRLVRLLCNACKQEYTLEPSHIKTLNGAQDAFIGKNVFKPRGCSKCFNTGYLGREAIFEVMLMGEGLKSLVLETSDSNRIKETALRYGMTTLRQDGMSKVLRGITSIGEVLRVTQE